MYQQRSSYSTDRNANYLGNFFHSTPIVSFLKRCRSRASVDWGV